MIRALLAMFMLSGSAQAGTLRVIDGDGFMIDGREIRIWGIDAPELTQECVDRAGRVIPCGQAAKRFLGQILADSAPVCETITIDRYGRHISRCQIGAHDLGRVMVLSGWALDYERYSKGTYAAAQADAEQNKRGLWGTMFLKPWDWRTMERESRAGG